MDQIAKTVNSFVAFIVGIGLICFATFVFLLASARLSNSTLGTLLAQSAGETARMARTESLAFWGQVGSEVATGLNYGRAPLSTGSNPNVTPVVIVATAPAPAPATTPQPSATPVPSAYVRSSPYSEGGLLLWRGLDADGKPLALGVDLEQVHQQASFALSQNPGDLMGLWLQKKVNECRPSWDQMVNADYRDPAQTTPIRTAAQALLQCNPRLFVAYANQRYADLWSWSAQVPIDESQADALLDGLQISVGAKVTGPARAMRAEDSVQVTVQAIPQFNLKGFTISLTAGTLDRLLGAGNWDVNNGPYTVGTGHLFPDNPPEPALPTDADLTPPDVTVQPQTLLPNLVNGKYVVQNGDTVYSIARKFNVTPADLIAANPDTLGVNPNYIVAGQELNIPSP